MTEKREINGATYKRTSTYEYDKDDVGREVDGHFFKQGFTPEEEYERQNATDAERKAARAAAPPDVVCECGSAAFELRYGNYELFARCSKCGAEESVYSG